MTLKECKMNLSPFMMSISHESSEAHLAPASLKGEDVPWKSFCNETVNDVSIQMVIYNVRCIVHSISQCWTGKWLKAKHCKFLGFISVNHIVQETSVTNSDSRDWGRRNDVSLKCSQMKALFLDFCMRCSLTTSKVLILAPHPHSQRWG